MAEYRCGYFHTCHQMATHWIEWPTIRRPKGAMVCPEHLRRFQDNGPLTVVEELSVQP